MIEDIKHTESENMKKESIRENRPEFIDAADVGPIITEKSETEIKDMMRNHRRVLCEKLLNLWHEAYATNNKEKDMQQAIGITIFEIQNIDIILRLTSVESDNKKQKEKI